MTEQQKLRRHAQFWNGERQERPLMIVRLKDLFLSRRFEAMQPLLEAGRELRPEDIDVGAFLADYERMFQELECVEQDGFFAAEPCTGLPWMEGIFGARAVGERVSVITRPVMRSAEQLAALRLDKENAWYRKYLEFSVRLTELSAGRFPVCQPILRGVTDTVGALIGQTELAYALVDEPELLKGAFHKIAEGMRELIRDQYRLTACFHGGRSIGFYHIWAPGSVIWYQEDLASLMSPGHYEEYLFETSSRILEGYDYSLVHLHPASFFHLDGILRLENLKAVQLNKDLVGPTTEDILPQCKKVLASGKRLVLGMGPISKRDIDVIYEELPHHGIAVNILADTAEEADELLAYTDSKKW